MRGKLPAFRLYRRPNSLAWWVQYRWRGRRYRLSMATVAAGLGLEGDMTDRADAERVLAVFRGDFARRLERGPAVPRPRPTALTLDRVLSCYEAGLGSTSEKNAAEQRRRCNVLREWFGRDAPAEEVTRSRVKAFEGAMRGQGLSEATVHGYLVALRAGYNAAADDGLYLGPMPIRKLRRPAPSEKFIPGPDLLRILGGLDPSRRDDRLILLLAYQGRRLSEANGARWEDFLWDEGLVRFRIAKKRGRPASRPFPLHPAVARLLRPMDEGAGPVCGYASPTSVVRKRTERLTRVGEEPGVPYSAHAFRHTYETRLSELGIRAEVRQALMAHEDLATTMVYDHHAQPMEALRRATETLAYGGDLVTFPGTVPAKPRGA